MGVHLAVDHDTPNGRHHGGSEGGMSDGLFPPPEAGGLEKKLTWLGRATGATHDLARRQNRRCFQRLFKQGDPLEGKGSTTLG